MKQLKDLKQVVKEGLELVKRESGLLEALVYASANRRIVGRIVYTTHIPCNGLEEPKSDEDAGVAVEIWVEKDGKKFVGLGHESNDLSMDAVKRALAKARRDMVEDPDFAGFFKPEGSDPNDPTRLAEALAKRDGHPNDPNKIHSEHSDELAHLQTPGASPHRYAKRCWRASATGGQGYSDRATKEEAKLLASIGWETIEGATSALSDYAKKHKKAPADLAFILNGDNFILQERMALATTNGIIDSDETTAAFSFLTAMFERENAKGSAWGARLSPTDGFSAFDVGKNAALAAINTVGGIRLDTGEYNVVFGPQAVTELFGNLLLPNLNLGLVDFGASIFTGKYGQQITSPLLTLYDDATLPGGAGTKRITCEGCPTGKTLLIDKGKLVGFLSDSRTTNKVLKKRDESKAKLGIDPHEIRHALSPRNGFRFSEGGGRIAAVPIGTHATNLVVESHESLSEGDVLKRVKNGLYIGRLWYTYPVGGMASGIISGTVIADSYVIRDGKLAEPILPNTLRLEDNLGAMVNNIVGIGNNQIPTILWASDEVTHAPWVGMKNVNFLSINNGT